jgi:hypothetical protein
MSFVQFVTQYGNQACSVSEPKRMTCSGPLQADKLRNVTVDGQGWELVFTDPAPQKGGLVITRSSNVVLRNLTIRWLDDSLANQLPLDKRIHSLGRVVGCEDGKRAALVVDQGGDATASIGAVSIWDERLGWPWEPRWSGKTVERYFPPLPEGMPMHFSNGRGPCLERLQPLAGNRVLIRHQVYSANAVHCFECERVAVEDVKIMSAPGMGLYFANSGRGFLLRNISIKPACDPNCGGAQPSVASDGIHFAASAGGIVIEDSDIGWQGDDSVNITGLLVVGRAQPTASELEAGWVKISESFKKWFWLFRIGTEVLLFDLGLQERGMARVLDLDKDRLRVKLSRLPNREHDIVVTPVDRVPRDVLVRNNKFHDHRGRAILMGASNALIEGNAIERLTMAAIIMAADTAFWFEGPGGTNIRIQGNRISKVNAHLYRPEYPSAISAALRPPDNYQGELGTPISAIHVNNNTFTDVFNNSANPVWFGRGATAR